MAETKPTPVVNVQSTIDDMGCPCTKGTGCVHAHGSEAGGRHRYEAMALAGLEAHMRLAKLAIEETKRGVYEDKITKNLYACGSTSRTTCAARRPWASSRTTSWITTS